MAASNRLTLIKIHMLLAAFIFPAALMFLVTGGLYTWGIKGSYVNEIHIIALSEPLAADESQLTELIKQELKERSIEPPSGKAKIKTGGTSFKVEWTGSDRDVVLQPTSDPLSAELVIKETTWYRELVQLHKAKGGQLFKVYAAVLAVSLFTILATGFVLALQMPKYRASAIFAAIAGIAMFLLMVSFS
jgi:hypothetical protein